jgi:hypothetical protein
MARDGREVARRIHFVGSLQVRSRAAPNGRMSGEGFYTYD